MEDNITENWDVKTSKLDYYIKDCDRSGNYLMFKEVTENQFQQLVDIFHSNPTYETFTLILCVLFAKENYDIIPSIMTDKSIEYLSNYIAGPDCKYKTVIQQDFYPWLSFFLTVHKYNSLDEDGFISSCSSVINNTLSNRPKDFISAIRNSSFIKKLFISYVKMNFKSDNEYAIGMLSKRIDENPMLCNFFCEEQPDTFLDILYYIDNRINLQIAGGYFYRDSIMSHLKGENRFLAAYYNDQRDKGTDVEEKLLSKLFKLDLDEKTYLLGCIKTYHNIHREFVEFLLRMHDANPGFMKKAMLLDNNYCKTSGEIIPFLHKYEGSPLIQQLIDLDIENLTPEQHYDLINKIAKMKKKPRIKGLNSVEELIQEPISELEKQGYVIDEKTAVESIIDTPRAETNLISFGAYKIVIKIYPNGRIKYRKCSYLGDHEELAKEVNDDEPELQQYETIGEFLCGMAMNDCINILIEGEKWLIHMPIPANMTSEAITSLISFINNQAWPESVFYYAFVFGMGLLSGAEEITKEEMLEILYVLKNNNVIEKGRSKI